MTALGCFAGASAIGCLLIIWWAFDGLFAMVDLRNGKVFALRTQVKLLKDRVKKLTDDLLSVKAKNKSLHHGAEELKAENVRLEYRLSQYES